RTGLLPAGGIYGRVWGEQACDDQRKEQRRGLGERQPAAGEDVGGGRVAQRLERGAEASETDATAPGDGAHRVRASWQKQAEKQVARRGVELKRVARRRPERREDDSPGERRRPAVAAAGEKAADAADGEGQEPRRDDSVEQRAGGPAHHTRDDDRRSEPGRDAARRREPARATPVQEHEEGVPADEGRRRD